jgi:hypothetical protein
MSVNDVDRPPTGVMPAAEVVHRRWVLSKRAQDGRPTLVRDERVARRSGFASRAPRPTAAKAAETTRGAPALT